MARSDWLLCTQVRRGRDSLQFDGDRVGQKARLPAADRQDPRTDTGERDCHPHTGAVPDVDSNPFVRERHIFTILHEYYGSNALKSAGIFLKIIHCISFDK